MAPRAKSAAFIVDGVQCSVDLKSRVVTVGSRLVGNDEHDRFKLPVGVPIEPRERLEAQVSERAWSALTVGPSSRRWRLELLVPTRCRCRSTSTRLLQLQAVLASASDRGARVPAAEERAGACLPAAVRSFA